jgi:hypothetical protein
MPFDPEVYKAEKPAPRQALGLAVVAPLFPSPRLDDRPRVQR